ncbi:phosphorylase family protein [Endozoicomonas numazuensis]|uniref:Nucleoside phosphorylase domain-containing protein n=1 Tax=Endozoicomonas numazuensis TaxID=1137799 RepID=A0A081NI74_9GAMM|nr:hypothetical protein [Endozoicomonas numazuensis]KEQ18147.1 hypothetical protein GZ78_11360 [Endozoicomonas numazuensis]
MKKITMIVAMKQEAVPLIEKLGLAQTSDTNPLLPCKAFSGEYKNLSINLVTNGSDSVHGVENVGTQPATLATYEALRLFSPDLIINAGTCGGFSDHGCKIGDVYMGERIRFFDRRIPMGDHYEAYGDSNYPCELAVELAQKLDLPTSIVCTGNSLDMSPTDEAILRQEPLVNKEMEAAAIAWVASHYQMPLVAVKSVTDLMDSEHGTADEFSSNLALASKNLQVEVLRLLDLLAQQSLTQDAA